MKKVNVPKQEVNHHILTNFAKRRRIVPASHDNMGSELLSSLPHLGNTLLCRINRPSLMQIYHFVPLVEDWLHDINWAEELASLPPGKGHELINQTVTADILTLISCSANEDESASLLTYRVTHPYEYAVVNGMIIWIVVTYSLNRLRSISPHIYRDQESILEDYKEQWPINTLINAKATRASIVALKDSIPMFLGDETEAESETDEELEDVD
jgi:hypothetical protein